MNSEQARFGEFMLLMAERCEREPTGRDQVVDCLQQVDEAFGGKLDPAREFEAYATWRLCRAIRKVLENG